LNKITFKINNEEETKKLGYEFGKIFINNNIKNSVISLIGTLAAGKTFFTKSFAKAININDDITSPTYTYINEYFNNINLFHFDVYMLNEIDEFFEMTFYEYLEKEGIKIVEWADKIEEIMPDNKIIININLNENINKREFIFTIPSNETLIYEEIKRIKI
jgi:tRNA threonylcarbamoyladenosine biosynthesis protein TsaE